MAFADVNLQDGEIGIDHGPGAGGWPTIRYCNKETGYKCAMYEKKTEEQMCVELGPNQSYLEEYIEKTGKPICGPGSYIEYCSGTAKTSVEAAEAMSIDALAAEIKTRNDAVAKLEAEFKREGDEMKLAFQKKRKAKNDAVKEIFDAGMGMNLLTHVHGFKTQPGAKQEL